jgi:2-dehydropantoate 2-reductase
MTTKAMTTRRIGILGLGGVGAYVGGRLASKFPKGGAVEIIFIARGENARAIDGLGLRMITEQGNETVHPTLVTEDPEVIGSLDILICATKAYDLQSAVSAVGACISPKTTVLPLLNGLENAEVLERIRPGIRVVDGCIFIVSKLIAPGVVEITGSKHFLSFGSLQVEKEKLDDLEELFSAAAIKYKRSDDIRKTIWEKYSFIAPLASLTTFLNQSVGQILENTEAKNTLGLLMREVIFLAVEQGIPLSESLVERNMTALQQMPFETTASMHRDVLEGRNSEYQSLNSYVVRLGRKMKIPTPEFEKINIELRKRFEQKTTE